MEPITIILVDDHHVMRQGLRSLLERELHCTVVGEAADGPTAIDLVARLTPDVLVVDLMLPGMSGIEVIRAVRASTPQTRVVVLSMHADDLYVREALRAGAIAYVIKEAQAAEFVLAVREAAAHRRYLSSALAERMIGSYLRQTESAIEDPYELLTARERDVLPLVALGATSAEVAARLGLSERTVETYRTNVMHKLDLRHQTDLVRYAIKRGLISLD
ncbi:MAG: response regulator transcription factor [Chloroflexales bacterium]